MPAGANHATYVRLFSANAVALVATGVTVVGMTLIAFDLAGDDAGAVIGTALAIKMLSLTLAPPFAAVFAGLVRPRALLIGLDLVRAGAILGLPFVTEVHQLYGLIAVFMVASATFVTVYHDAVARLLPDPDDYLWALSKSRIVYEVENAASPLIAAALLIVMSERTVFVAAAGAFLVSAAILARVEIDRPAAIRRRAALGAIATGVAPFFRAPLLRPLPLLAVVAAAAVAAVSNNTVVLVQGELELGARATALALAAFGTGTAVGAVLLPRLLDGRGERWAFKTGAALVIGGLAVSAFLGHFATILLAWILLGFAVALVQTPIWLVIRRAAQAGEQPSLMAGGLTVNNGSLLLAYPLAGWLAATAGVTVSAIVLAALAAIAAAGAVALAPRAAVARQDLGQEGHTG